MRIPGLLGTALTALVAAAFSLPATASTRTATPQFVSIPSARAAVGFAVHLPLRNQASLEGLVELQSDPESPMFRHWLTPAQFRASFGPAPGTIARTVAAMRAQGLAVTKVETQLIHVSGTVANVERAFAVHLGNVRDKNGAIRLAARESLSMPSALATAGATVVGLAYQVPPKPQSHIVPLNRYSTVGPYWFDDLKEAYDYPAYPTLTGTGMTIATVGYSDFSDSDAKLYFRHEKLGDGAKALAPEPTIERYVFPGSDKFDPNDGASDEADLDVQQAAGSAPGATVVGIAAPDTEGEGFLLAYSFIDESNAFDIVSTSYGECELFYTPAYNYGADYTGILKAYHDLFVQGNSQGTTFLFSSGDDSGRSCPEPGYILDPGEGKIYKDVPGTSIWSDDPNVTSVGGTNLVTSLGTSTDTSSTYVSENANADVITAPYDPYGTGNFISNGLWGSGGGPSVVFKAPAYQAASNTGSAMRVDPDVAMQMGGCPLYENNGQPVPERCNKNDSADLAVVGGQIVGLIGTSASSPEFAGLLAVKEQALGGTRLGNANVSIYRTAAKNATLGAFHQGFPAYNGVVRTDSALGYNQIVGNGTPDALKFIGAPRGIPAGNPQTPTNP